MLTRARWPNVCAVAREVVQVPHQRLDTDTLTLKRKLFVSEFVRDANATQAAIRAGYSPATAAAQASRLLSKVNVQQAVAAKMQAAAEAADIDAAWVLRNWRKVVDMAMRDDETRELSAANTALASIAKYLRMMPSEQPASTTTNHTLIIQRTDIQQFSADELRALLKALPVPSAESCQ